MVNIWSFFTHSIGSVCPLCHAPGDGLCMPCRAALPSNDIHCSHCALPLPPGTPGGALCAGCQTRPPAFDGVIAPLRYASPVDDLVSGFKYRRRLALGRMLADILGEAVLQYTDATLPALLLPVPMHANGLRQRGFNQAAELARLLARRTDIPWRPDGIVRTRHAGHQRGLTRSRRRRNLRGAFACNGRLPARVALIDDVVTTGATADEISRILKRSGVDRVDVWAVARTPRDVGNGAAGL